MRSSNMYYDDNFYKLIDENNSTLTEIFGCYTADNKAAGCTLNDKEKQIYKLGCSSILVSWYFPCTVWGTELWP